MTPTASYGTKLLETTVFPAPGGGFWWRRRVGPRASEPFSDVPVTRPVGHAAAGAGRVVFARGDGAEKWYPTTGSATLASALLEVGIPTPDTLAALTAFGAALRSLHDPAAPPHPSLPVRPRPAGRMLRWFDARATTPLGARFHLNAVHELGQDALDRLRSRLDTLPDIRSGVMLHGAPGLGSVVLSDDGGIELLTGEDIAVGDPAHDVNWVVGELTELSWASSAPQAWQPAIEAFLAGYGSDGDVDRELIALRVLVHAHDFVSYVQWQEELQGEYLRFVGHLLGAGR